MLNKLFQIQNVSSMFEYYKQEINWMNINSIFDFWVTLMYYKFCGHNTNTKNIKLKAWFIANTKSKNTILPK